MTDEKTTDSAASALSAGLADDLARLDGLDGVHMGMLDAEEMDAFNRLKDAGLAMREYSGPAGFFGVARLRLLPANVEGNRPPREAVKET